MRPSASIAFLALGLFLLVAGFSLSFWAGCTGDLKGGALGDPTAALRLQDFAAMAAIASTVSLIGSAAKFRSKSAGTKAMLAVAVVLGTALVWFTVGWEAEVKGVRQCFATQ